jgi:hypothetical protein
MSTVSVDDAVSSARKPRNTGHGLYIWGAVGALLVIFAGFARTYYLKGAFGTPDLSVLKHAHGLVMTAWFTLFLVQVRLVATGRTAVHRKLGIAGAVLAALVVIVGTATALVAAKNGATPGPPPLVFLAIPLGDMLVFVTIVSAAILYRKRSDYHKRLMLLASLSILTAAIARIPVDFLQAGGLPAFFGTTDLLIIAFVAFDSVRSRRLHPAFLAGTVFVIASQVGRFLVAGTPQWTSFARWLVG